MAKRTAIIDIGSNSARLVIFEKTSRYGFHLICEQKSKVRIGEGAYEKEGHLQPIGIKRAFLTLQSFLHTIQKYQAHKTLSLCGNLCTERCTQRQTLCQVDTKRTWIAYQNHRWEQRSKIWGYRG
jgi:hypothetical protein